MVKDILEQHLMPTAFTNQIVIIPTIASNYN